MLAAAVASMFGNLCGAVLAGPRSVFALGRTDFCPASSARCTPGTIRRTSRFSRSPLWRSAFGLSGSFEQPRHPGEPRQPAGVCGVALAAWRLRATGVRLEGEPFGLPGGPLVPVLACAAIGAVIVATGSSGRSGRHGGRDCAWPPRFTSSAGSVVGAALRRPGAAGLSGPYDCQRFSRTSSSDPV
jgi:hypothetical protein